MALGSRTYRRICVDETRLFRKAPPIAQLLRFHLRCLRFSSPIGLGQIDEDVLCADLGGITDAELHEAVAWWTRRSGLYYSQEDGQATFFLPEQLNTDPIAPGERNYIGIDNFFRHFPECPEKRRAKTAWNAWVQENPPRGGMQRGSNPLEGGSAQDQDQDQDQKQKQEQEKSSPTPSPAPASPAPACAPAREDGDLGLLAAEPKPKKTRKKAAPTDDLVARWIEAYEHICTGLSPVPASAHPMIAAAVKREPDGDLWVGRFRRIDGSDWHNGRRGPEAWRADAVWVAKPANCAKIDSMPLPAERKQPTSYDSTEQPGYDVFCRVYDELHAAALAAGEPDTVELCDRCDVGAHEAQRKFVEGQRAAKRGNHGGASWI